MKRPSKISDYRKAANQEFIWADSAMNEYRQEHRRAHIARKKGYTVFARELEWDVRMCKLWHDMRTRRAQHYMSHIKKVKSRQ